MSSVRQHLHGAAHARRWNMGLMKFGTALLQRLPGAESIAQRLDNNPSWRRVDLAATGSLAASRTSTAPLVATSTSK